MPTEINPHPPTANAAAWVVVPLCIQRQKPIVVAKTEQKVCFLAWLELFETNSILPFYQKRF
jgi:hypothetical protein